MSKASTPVHVFYHKNKDILKLVKQQAYFYANKTSISLYTSIGGFIAFPLDKNPFPFQTSCALSYLLAGNPVLKTRCMNIDISYLLNSKCAGFFNSKCQFF